MIMPRSQTDDGFIVVYFMIFDTIQQVCEVMRENHKHRSKIMLTYLQYPQHMWYKIQISNTT